MIIRMPVRFDFDCYKWWNREVLFRVDDEKPEAVILDMIDTDYIDSSGMGMILMLRDRCNKCGIRIEVKNKAVQHTLKVAQFHRLFNVVNSLETY